MPYNAHEKKPGVVAHSWKVLGRQKQVDSLGWLAS